MWVLRTHITVCSAPRFLDYGRGGAPSWLVIASQLRLVMKVLRTFITVSFASALRLQNSCEGLHQSKIRGCRRHLLSSAPRGFLSVGIYFLGGKINLALLREAIREAKLGISKQEVAKTTQTQWAGATKRGLVRGDPYGPK